MEKLTLPSMEHSFFFECEGDSTKKAYRGDFTYVRPNIGTLIEISKLEARYNGETSDADIKTLNRMRANLAHCIKVAPDWWNKSNFGADLYDANVITSLYLECLKFENNWYSKVWSDDSSKQATPEK